MAIKDNFLREVKIGDTVELMIGSKEMTGIVVALDLDTVRIRRENGKEPVLSLDSISYYEVGEDEQNELTEMQPAETSSQKEKQLDLSQVIVDTIKEVIGTDSLTSEKKPDSTIVESKEDRHIGSIDVVLEELKKRGTTFFDTIETPEVTEFKEVAKACEEASLRNEMMAIADSLEYAIKQVHEISPADYKIQENIGKIKRLIRNNPKSKAPSNLLGAVYYRCKCESLALDEYEKGDDYISGFAIAERLNNEEKKKLFAVRHFVYGKRQNPYIIKYLLSKMFMEEDYSLCSKINVKNVTAMNLPSYHSVLRAVFIYTQSDYNAMLDYDVTESGLEDLIKLYNAKNFGTNKALMELLPQEVVKVKTDTSVVQDNRTLEECPIFAAAEHARMEEKNLSKAEKLYIKAIENNEKPGSAVANLYQILIQKRKFDDCAMYLGRYGSKYMREEAYKNLKKQLLSMNPRLAAKIAKYEKEDSDPIDYFVLAQKAELDEKDLQKAITYYKKAIELKQRLTGSIPNLVSIYSRLEMFPEALKLLDSNGKSVMDKSAYLNLKQSVLVKAKDRKYKREIDDTFGQMVAMAATIDRKTEIAVSKAYLLVQIEEYDDAVKTYVECLSNCQKKSYPSDKKNKQKIYILTGLCNIYIHRSEIDEARKYAEQIIDIDSNHEFALSILNGNINEDAELIDENIGVTHINGYIQKHLEELSLDSEVKVKDLLENGLFIGTQEKASSILNSIMDPRNRSVNEEAKSNQYLAGAKLIRQILSRDEDIDTDKFNEQRFLYFVAEGTCSYANSRIYRTELADNMDVARYFYIQPITIFNDSEKMRSSWAVATIRYIQTFFDSLENIRKEGNGLYQKYKDHKSCTTAIQRIMQNPIKVDVDIFTIGMIELLTYNTKIKKQVLSYINVNAFQGRILDVLAKLIGSEVPDINTLADFEEIWDKAAQSYYAQRKAYMRLISETIESVFVVGRLQENLEKLNISKFDSFLNKTDREYVKSLLDIFTSISRYNEIAEFDYKAETLKRADDARKRLEERIEEYPTYLSYEKLLPALMQLQVKIFKESSLLYGNSEPQLSVSLSGDCSVEEEGKVVRVPLAISNKANAQNADNVQISIIGENVENVNDTQLSRGLLVGDGRAKEEMVTFHVNDKVLDEAEFSIVITITYQYLKNMTETAETSNEFVLSVPLYSGSEFEPIDNRFEPHKNGSEVKDVSMFYGRDKDIESIIAQISDKNGRILQGRCLALYGQTRTGKSSLLYHLEKKLREINPKGNIIVNIGSIGEENLSGNDITEFLYTLLDGLKNEIQQRHPELIQVMDIAGIELDADKLLDDPDHSQLFFNNEFKRMSRLLADQSTQYNIIIMIDEFTYIYDWIRQGTMTDRIMKFWKAFIQNNGLFAIIIGQDHMMRFVEEKQFTNDFGSTDLRKITYLPEEDAKRLMYEPIMLINEDGEKVNRYREGALDRLYELTSGSAFLIMNICAGLVDYLNEVHSVYITRAHIDDYLRRNLTTFEEARFFEPQYDDKSEVGTTEAINRNKRMLRRIAQLSNKKEWTPLQSVIESDEDRNTIKNLESRDVIIIENNDRCKIKVALYKEWILEKYGVEASYE